MVAVKMLEVLHKSESEESIVWAMKHVSKGYPGFEIQSRHHQMSNTGVPVARKKDLCPTISKK